MQYRRAQTIAVLAVTVAACAAASGWPDPIPRLSVQVLTGSTLSLPDDLPAGVSILVIGFTQKAGDNTRPWAERLRRDFAPSGGFTVYSVAVLAGVPALFRPFAVSSIRDSVSPSDRSGFLVVNRDESAWRVLAGYRLPDDPYVVALDQRGDVLARASGLFSEERCRQAEALIQSAAAQRSSTWN
jgi:hypothetical protein